MSINFHNFISVILKPSPVYFAIGEKYLVDTLIDIVVIVIL